jgi:signal transduction histidine kinase
MSLRLRLMAAFAYVLILVLGAIEVPFALSIRSRIDSEVRAQAVNEAHLIAASASGRMDDPDALDRLAARAAEDLGARVIVVDGAGRLAADSAGPGLRGSSYASREEIDAVLATGRAVQGKRRSETIGETLLYTAVPVIDEGRRSGAVRVTQSTAAIDDRVRRDVRALAAIGAAALLFGLALAWVLAGSLARPLRGLAAAARRAGSGDLDARAELSGPAEQRDVAAAFNQMVARLGTVLAAQREFVGNASHQLRTPLTGLRLRLEAASLRAADPALERELAEAEHETVRLAKLLDGLLMLAREGESTVPARPVDLASAASAAADRWLAHGREIAVAGEGRPAALASEGDLATILDSLVENALLYTTPDSEISIEWGGGDAFAFVAVLDRGPGIAEGEEEAVFERFRRGSAGLGVTPGTGLGLAIARTLAAGGRGGGRAMKATILLLVSGVVLAAALGFAAHVVAQDTIGLPAVSLEGGRPLAPQEARERATETETETEPETETRPTTETEVRTDNSGPGSSSSGPGSGEPGDDSGGRGRGGGGDD